MHRLGIDIGGSSIKAARVSTQDGSTEDTFITIPLPSPSLPEAIIEAIRQVVKYFNYRGPLGCGFPGVIKQGVVYKAANLHPSWLGYPFAEQLFKATGCRPYIVNDAAAAGIAELRLGAAKGFTRSWIMVTVGTGLGTALFHNACLFPNTELGQLMMDGHPAESMASAAAFRKYQLTWEVWGKRLEAYLHYLEDLFWPDTIVLGGAIVQEWQQFAPYVQLKCALTPAHFLNKAGCIGAALGTLHS